MADGKGGDRTKEPHSEVDAKDSSDMTSSDAPDVTNSDPAPGAAGLDQTEDITEIVQEIAPTQKALSDLDVTSDISEIAEEVSNDAAGRVPVDITADITEIARAVDLDPSDTGLDALADDAESVEDLISEAASDSDQPDPAPLDDLPDLSYLVEEVQTEESIFDDLEAELDLGDTAGDAVAAELEDTATEGLAVSALAENDNDEIIELTDILPEDRERAAELSARFATLADTPEQPDDPIAAVEEKVVSDEDLFDGLEEELQPLFDDPLQSLASEDPAELAARATTWDTSGEKEPLPVFEETIEDLVAGRTSNDGFSDTDIMTAPEDDAVDAEQPQAAAQPMDAEDIGLEDESDDLDAVVDLDDDSVQAVTEDEEALVQDIGLELDAEEEPDLVLDEDIVADEPVAVEDIVADEPVNEAEEVLELPAEEELVAAEEPVSEAPPETETPQAGLPLVDLTERIAPQDLEQAVERVVEKVYASKIETLLVSTIEKTVSKEIERLKNLLMEDME